MRRGRRLIVVADDELHLGMFEESDDIANAPEAGTLMRLLEGELPQDNDRRRAFPPFQHADVVAAQKAVLDTTTVFKAAEVKLTQMRATVLASQQAVKNAQADVRAKEVLSQSLTEASTKVKAEADKVKDNAPLQVAATRALAFASQATAELTLARKALVDLEAASRVVEPTLVPVQQAFNVAQVAATEAPKKLPALVVAQKAAQTKAAADKVIADKALAELNEAKAVVTKLTPMVPVAVKK